jgi:hypothetical protein
MHGEDRESSMFEIVIYGVCKSVKPLHRLVPTDNTALFLHGSAAVDNNLQPAFLLQFKLIYGLKDGDALSPLLFNGALNTPLGRSKSGTEIKRNTSASGLW